MPKVREGEDHGIPAHEVRFIQEAKSNKQRKELIKWMNEGKIHHIPIVLLLFLFFGQ